MSGAPDKRVWLLMTPVIVLAVALAILPRDHEWERIVELLLYVACAVLGIAAAALSLRERQSLFRPTHTLDETPILFWMDVAIGYGVFTAIAVWKTAKVLNVAL